MRSINRFAVVRDTRRPAREVGGALGVSGTDHPPTVDKNLRTDLLGDDRSVRRDTAAFRRANTCLEAQVSGVFRRAPQTAPPEDRPIFDEDIQPPVADLGGGDIRRAAVFGDRPQKRERPADVIVGDDERDAHPFVDVAIDLAQFALNTRVGPSLKRPSQVDPDDLP